MGEDAGVPDPAEGVGGRLLLQQAWERGRLPGVWQLNGWGVLGRYVFLYHQDAALAVQVDDKLDADQAQGDEELRRHGVTTLRFTSDQVTPAELDRVVEQITEAVAAGLATRTTKKQVASLAAAAMDARSRPLTAVEAAAEQPCEQLDGSIAAISRQLAERTSGDPTEWADRITAALAYLPDEDRCHKGLNLVAQWWNEYPAKG